MASCGCVGKRREREELPMYDVVIAGGGPVVSSLRRAKDDRGFTAMLVRPDGFVAWLAESELDLSTAEESI